MSFLVAKVAPFSVPGACVIIPGRTSDPDGFVDTTTQLDGLRGPLNIYLSVAGIRQLASRHREVGLVPRAELEGAQMQMTQDALELGRLRDQVAILQAAQDRISGLTRSGFDVVKAKGPRPTTTRNS